MSRMGRRGGNVGNVKILKSLWVNTKAFGQFFRYLRYLARLSMSRKGTSGNDLGNDFHKVTALPHVTSSPASECAALCELLLTTVC